MPKKKLTVDDVAELINECGLEEAILHSCDADEIGDNDLSILWEQANQLLQDIMAHIDGHKSEDYYNEDVTGWDDVGDILSDEDLE